MACDCLDQVIILARECGLQLELDDIKIDKLLPESLQVSNFSTPNQMIRFILLRTVVCFLCFILFCFISHWNVAWGAVRKLSMRGARIWFYTERYEFQNIFHSKYYRIILKSDTWGTTKNGIWHRLGYTTVVICWSPTENIWKWLISIHDLHIRHLALLTSFWTSFLVLTQRLKRRGKMPRLPERWVDECIVHKCAQIHTMCLPSQNPFEIIHRYRIIPQLLG